MALGQYSRAKAYQTDQGVTFNLTFLEYQALWKKDQLEKLIYWHKHNRLVSAMKPGTEGLFCRGDPRRIERLASWTKRRLAF